MNLREREVYEKIRKSINEGLQKFIGADLKSTKEDISLAVQKMLANMEADLYGHKVTKCDTLWNTFSLKEKAKWLLWNVLIPSKGEAARLKIDLANEKARFDQVMEEMNEREEVGYGEEPEELHWSYLAREQYPDYAVLSPKSVVRIETIVRPKAAMTFIPLSIQLKDVKVENE